MTLTLHRLRRFDGWWVVLALALVAALTRAQTFGSPVIGYDEQFYLLVGDRMWHGALPYVDIFDRKPIGLFLIYAAARGLGGAGFLQYQLVALSFVVATAFLIYRAALTHRSQAAAFIAATLYIIWLNFTEGEGGQAELFINLPMLAAALLVWRAVTTQRRIVTLGATAMLLVGLALQIKYTALFEGLFFGLTLIWAQYCARRSVLALAAPIGLWIACALTPTLLVMLCYWRLHALDSFVFANFFSQFGRPASAVAPQAVGFSIICGILLPLIIVAAGGWRVAPRHSNFIYAWAGAAAFGLIAFGSFLSPHYAQTLIAPLALLTVPCFAQNRRTQVYGALFALLFFTVAQTVLYIIYTGKGGRAMAERVAYAAQPRRGCLYVYDGFPALYLLTHSCLPTRWPFPGQLNTHSEDSVKALGIDPVVEEQRILDARPEVIVDYAPPYALGNRRTYALLQRELAAHYKLTHRFKTGSGDERLVYRRRN